MPVPPAEDPPLESFGALVDLASLPQDDVRGPLPWKRSDAVPLALADTSPLWFGGGVFGQGMYNRDDVLHSDAAVRALRLAFQYGINALDSSPYYFPSELVLGRALRILRDEHPRATYFLATKCGRYGPQRAQFDYSAARITRSIHESLQRLGTTYLDAALLHDVEFVSSQPDAALTDAGRGLPAAAVGDEPDAALRALGLAPGDAARVRGAGDERVLEAARALFALQDAGVVRHVGISGYPLGELVRLARLIASHPPYRCLDLVLSYSHHTLHADLLPRWQRLFEAVPWPDDARPPGASWRAPMVLNASPFSMGLFSDGGPPPWHPADAALRSARQAALDEIRRDAAQPGSHVEPARVLGSTALFAGLRGAEDSAAPQLRTLLGMSHVDEVHTAIDIYRVRSSQGSAPAYAQLAAYEATVRAHMTAAGAADQVWRSPPADA